MKTPPWLAAELETLNQHRVKNALSRDEAIDRALDTATSKDPDLMAQIHYEWFAGRVDDSYKRLQSKRLGQAVKEHDRKTTELATGYVQPVLHDDLFPGPDSTLLTEDGEYAQSLYGRAERHMMRASKRLDVYEQRVEAVGGNQDGKATRAQAIKALAAKALRRASGGMARA